MVTMLPADKSQCILIKEKLSNTQPIAALHMMVSTGRHEAILLGLSYTELKRRRHNGPSWRSQFPSGLNTVTTDTNLIYYRGDPLLLLCKILTTSEIKRQKKLPK